MASCPSTIDRRKRTRITRWPGRLPRGGALCAPLALGMALTPEVALAEAETLDKGDLSLAVYESLEPFNRYWYRYNGLSDCKGEPCSRFNFNSYQGYTIPVVDGETYTIPDTLLATTGLRLEYGLFNELTLSGETQLVYSNPGSPALSLGDSRLGARWLAANGPLLVSFSGIVKLPGTYSPNQIGAPGSKQTDVELRSHFGGLAARRKVFYDVAIGYRLRLDYPKTAILDVAPIEYASPEDPSGTVNTDAARTYLISGPADEAFFEGAVGFYPSRRTLLYLNANGVNSFSGYHLSDYFRAVATDDLDRPRSQVSGGDPSNILTSLEEDYLRVGIGVLFKAWYNTTVFFNYSYLVLGQNTAGSYVLESGVPIGAVSIGLEYTFATRKRPASGTPTARRSDLQDSTLSMRLSGLRF